VEVYRSITVRRRLSLYVEGSRQELFFFLFPAVIRPLFQSLSRKRFSVSGFPIWLVQATSLVLALTRVTCLTASLPDYLTSPSVMGSLVDAGVVAPAFISFRSLNLFKHSGRRQHLYFFFLFVTLAPVSFCFLPRALEVTDGNQPLCFSTPTFVFFTRGYPLLRTDGRRPAFLLSSLPPPLECT